MFAFWDVDVIENEDECELRYLSCVIMSCEAPTDHHDHLAWAGNKIGWQRFAWQLVRFDAWWRPRQMGHVFWASHFTLDCISCTYPQETREQVKWKAFISMVLSHKRPWPPFHLCRCGRERIVFTLCLHRGAMFDVIVGIISNSILLQRPLSLFVTKNSLQSSAFLLRTSNHLSRRHQTPHLAFGEWVLGDHFSFWLPHTDHIG